MPNGCTEMQAWLSQASIFCHWSHKAVVSVVIPPPPGKGKHLPTSEPSVSTQIVSFLAWQTEKRGGPHAHLWTADQAWKQAWNLPARALLPSWAVPMFVMQPSTCCTPMHCHSHVQHGKALLSAPLISDLPILLIPPTTYRDPVIKTASEITHFIRRNSADNIYQLRLRYTPGIYLAFTVIGGDI